MGKYYLLFTISLLALFSCEDDTITISPDMVNLNCDEQKIMFHTDKPFTQIVIWQYDTDSSSEKGDVDEDWKQVITGDWYMLKGKLHSSNEIELYVEANRGDARQLKFSVNRGACNDIVIVTQSGSNEI